MDLSQIDTFEELCEFLVKETPDKTTDDAVFDHILTSDFFSQLTDFDQRSDITEEEVEFFKENFPYDVYTLDKEELQDKLKNYRSIRRVIDEIIEEIPKEVKENIMRQHIKDVWFEQNFNGDLQSFKNNLKTDYWSND